MNQILTASLAPLLLGFASTTHALLQEDPASDQQVRAPAAVAPDILYLVVDDLGWHDVGFTGGTSHPTPVIDGLAADCMVFENAYADAPNCAPTRASLLSGQATARHGVLTVGSSARGKAADRAIEPVPNQRFLDPAQDTLADDLRAAGYRTVHVGKFHLGRDPIDYGFTDQRGGTGAGHPKSYRSPYRNPALPDGPEGEYLTDRLVEESVRFVESDDPRPLFLQLSFFSVHTPIQPRPDLLAASRARLAGSRPRDQKYDAMVLAVDAAVGRVLREFTAHRSRPLMVVFTSDNGGYGPLADNGPLRGSKGMLYEGGIRVPLAVRWPTPFEPGRCDVPVLLRDLVPTIHAAAGVSPPERSLDGRNLEPAILGRPMEATALHWHFPVYLERDASVEGPWRTTPVAACRLGSHKLIEFFDTGAVELYDLDRDPAETVDLSLSHPDLVRLLQQEMERGRGQVGARLPSRPSGPRTSTERPDAPRPEGTP